jgi:hypothetical protein
MPRAYSSIEKIRAELAWVNETQPLKGAAAAMFLCCRDYRRLELQPE